MFFWKTVLRDRTSTIWTHHVQPFNILGLIIAKVIIQKNAESMRYWVTLGQHGSPVCQYVRLSGSCNSLGTPETSRRGRSTRKARRALTSNPPGLPPWPCIDGWLLSPSPSPFSSLVKSSKTTLKRLQRKTKTEKNLTILKLNAKHTTTWLPPNCYTVCFMP